MATLTTTGDVPLINATRMGDIVGSPNPIVGSIPIPQPQIMGGVNSPFGGAPNMFADMDSPVTMPLKKPLQLTRFQTSLHRIEHEPGEYPQGSVEWYYEQTDIADAVDAIGWWNPVLSGRPKHFAQMMLNGLPAPVPGRGLFWKLAGLMYFTPMITDRAKSRNRTTLTGLLLMKHWAECFPKFAPFFDAYYSAKAEREISLECVDLAMGLVPVSFKRRLEKHVVATETKHRLEQARKAIEQQARAEAEYRHRLSMQQQQYQYDSGRWTGLGDQQSNLLGAQTQQQARSLLSASAQAAGAAQQYNDMQRYLNDDMPKARLQQMIDIQRQVAMARDVQKESRFRRILESLPQSWRLK